MKGEPTAIVPPLVDDVPPTVPLALFPIPWQPFSNAFRRRLDPTSMCLWWVPVRGTVEVFVGRVAYWAAVDAAFVSRKSGSMIRVSDDCFFAIITEPPAMQRRALDDAISVSADPRDAIDSPARLAAPAPGPAAEPPADAGTAADPPTV